MEKQKRKKYWYFYTIYYCPICCKEIIYKERRYTKKPKYYEDRISVRETWDYCGAF